MSTEQTEAIILRSFPWSETSLVVNMFTRDFGKLAMVAKGARRPKGPFEAALDLLSRCRIVFISKSSDALDILTEAKLQRRFRGGSQDLLRLYSGYYVAELLDKMTDKGERAEEVFLLAAETLSAIEDVESEIRAVVLRFELQMLRLTGHAPSWEQCVQCGTKHSNESDHAGWCFFSVLSGGVLCERCHQGARMLLRVPTAAVTVLDAFSCSDWQSIDVHRFTTKYRAVVRGVLVKYLTVTLDRKLQLHSYLEELGR